MCNNSLGGVLFWKLSPEPYCYCGRLGIGWTFGGPYRAKPDTDDRKFTFANITILPKVIWEEGRVAAKVSPNWLEWCAPNSPRKCPFLWADPQTCLIPGPVRPTMPNGIRIRSAVFSTMHWTNRRTHRRTDAPTDRSSTGKFDDYSPLRL